MAAASLGFEGGEYGFLSPMCSLPYKDFWTPGYESPMTKLRMVKYIGPQCFWLQNLRQEKELHSFGIEMTEWYDLYWEEATPLRKDQVIVGGVYAAYWEKYQLWLRVRIHKIMKEGAEEDALEFRVFSLDYGNMTNVPLDHICPLRETFNEFPIQVVRAETYDESDLKTYTSPEIHALYNFIAGKDLDTLVLDERKTPWNGSPLITIMLPMEPIQNNTEITEIPSKIFTIDGKLKMDNFFRMVQDLNLPQQ